MDGRGTGQSGQIVTTFQCRNNPALAMFVGDFHQLSRGPNKIFVVQPQRCQGVGLVGVETRRDQQEFRLEIDQRRQDYTFPDLPKLPAAGPGRQRRVDDIAGCPTFRLAAGSSQNMAWVPLP
jgi:hypothetical protein